MSIRTSIHHTVAVMLDDRGDVDRVTFTCDAPPDADCRNTPVCDCEAWHWNADKTADEAGHPRVPGQDCWVASWFEGDGAVYAGPDADIFARDDGVPAVERSGLIAVTWSEDFIEWTWRADAPQDDELDLGARGEEADRGDV